MIYKKSKTKEISFPLGGIGTGCIGLAGNGALIDWEIFNKPNKGSGNGFSHFAIKAEANGEVLDARVLNGNLQPPYTGSLGDPLFNNFGFGPRRTTMAGAPHFEEAIFTGEFPIASIAFEKEGFPGAVVMEAFNPFIPLNEYDSGIPGAFFDFTIENTTDLTIDYTVCLSLSNPHDSGRTVNKYSRDGDLHFIKLDSLQYRGEEPERGDLTAAVVSDAVSYQEYWYRGKWFDSLQVFWREFSTSGKFQNRRYEADDNFESPYPGSVDTASLAAHITLIPQEIKHVKFVITWSSPNCYNYWNPEECCAGDGCCDTNQPKGWKNYYSTVFPDSKASAQYALEHWNRLYRETLEFKNTLFSSTLPPAALDAISANISILKTPTCLRLEDGSFYGWEGCHPDSGCCEGSCTHVWNYAYALPFLFPNLERSMRDLDFKYNQGEDGGMGFRLQLPLGRERSGFRPCADGQFGGVIKAYRDWKISGDTDWLKTNWGAIRKSISYAWSPANPDRWDADKDGVLEGRQHHTLDMELFGPNSWLTGFYLAALKAGAVMADFLGEKETSQEYWNLFDQGKQWVDENLFNGEYYQQIIDLKDKSILEQYNEMDFKTGESAGESASEDYWNAEKQEIKYQIGEGCAIDQVLAQWHANLCGLGEIFDQDQTRKALQSLYRYNFKNPVGNHFNPCRLFSLNEEAGIVICDWPEKRYKPVVPITYAEETMNGFEYQAAIHMIQEGMLEEGLAIVTAVRDRYDGEKRNPWNEFECGSNYARSMASYALLNAYSGFEYNMVEGMIGFNPLAPGKEVFQCFWSLDSGWGQFKIKDNSIQLSVLHGSICLKQFRSGVLKGRKVHDILLGKQQINYVMDDGGINFESLVYIDPENGLHITME